MDRDDPGRAAARQVLDAARAGAPVTSAQITEALIDSGDLDAIPLVRLRRAAGTRGLKNPCALLSPATWADPVT